MDKEPHFSLIRLPHVLILEICGVLDMESLVALSRVNRLLNNLSKTFKSYWLPSVLQSGVVLPVPIDIPLHSFTPIEIYRAALRAVTRDRNLSLPRPQLYSHTLIEWPPPRRIAQPTHEPIPFGHPLDATSINISHPSGDWLFLISTLATLRIINLKFGVCVLEEQYSCWTSASHIDGPRTADKVSIDLKSDDAGVMALVTLEQMEDAEGSSQQMEIVPVLRVIEMSFTSQPLEASVFELAQVRLEVLPEDLDIFGDWIILLVDGTARLLNWKSRQWADLPQLHPSFSVSMFDGYFFLIGEITKHSAVFQVVAYPWNYLRQRQDLSISANSKSIISTDEDDSFSLVASITIPPRTSPASTKIRPDSVRVCHQFKGLLANVIKLWFQDDYDSWNVFTLTADFGRHPRGWFSHYDYLADGEGRSTLTEEDLSRVIEHKRVFNSAFAEAWIEPLVSGRRFMWWERSLRQTVGGLLDMDPSSEGCQQVTELFSSVTDRIPRVHPDDAFVVDIRDDSYRNLVEVYGSQKMVLPEMFAVTEAHDENRIFILALEEWSGTGIAIMRNGSIWVLRYGHP